MLRISSDCRDWSMKWLSIFAVSALKRFSRGEQWQPDLPRAASLLFLLPLWEKVARSAG
ncbi:hypothetical protein GGD61_003141 [Bradyrhizobium sp. SBR1B]|nr:hypothetical protein [Bradyrhizobium sp. SBR1B]